MARFLKYKIPNKKSDSLKELITDSSAWVSNGELLKGFEAVDILWESNPLFEFKQYEVYPEPCGVHTFMGCEELYQLEYDNYINK